MIVPYITISSRAELDVAFAWATSRPEWSGRQETVVGAIYRFQAIHPIVYLGIWPGPMWGWRSDPNWSDSDIPHVHANSIPHLDRLYRMSRRTS